MAPSRHSEIVGASAIVRDNTQIVQSQQQILRERDTAQRYLDVAGVMILVLDVTGTVTLINRRGCTILGYDDPKDIVGKSWIDFFIPERMRAKMRELFGRLIRGDEVAVEFNTNPVVTREGEERIIGWHNSLLTDDAGRITASLSSGDDITERTRIETALRDRESLLANAQRVAAIGVWELDVPRNQLTWSDETYRIFGVAPENFGHTFEAFLALIHPADAKRVTVLSSHAPADGSSVECEYRILRPDGQERIVFDRGEIVRDGEGRALRRLGVVWDITDRKQSEQALRRSEARFRELAENIQEVFWLSTVGENKILYVSPAFESIWGLSIDELYRSPLLWLEAIHPEDRPRVLEALAKQVTGEYNEEYRIVRPDGAIRWISDRAFPIRNELGHIYRIAGVAQDVTERKQTETQLRQAQKMESIGQLTGGIAHDFNNLLGIILLNLELVSDRLSADPEAGKMVSSALHAAERGASLTHQLLAYSRRQPLEPKIVNLEALVSKMTNFSRRTLGENIEIETVMPPDLWPTRIDPHQLENALLNLAVNARDAMPNGGRLIIEAANQVFDETCVEQNPEISPGDYVVVSVSDTGTGMPKEILERVLDPFFTTKPVGKGSGLGLSMVHGFVKQSGGHLKIDSEFGHGTTIRLYLPRAPSSAIGQQKDNHQYPVPSSASGEVILVVEDDAVLRRLTVQILAGLGYRTIEAADGSAACQVIDRAGNLDLLLTDVVLTMGISGPELACMALTRRPGLKILYMSGYPGDAMVQTGLWGERIQLLTKPFTRGELAGRVREILDHGNRA